MVHRLSLAGLFWATLFLAACGSAQEPATVNTQEAVAQEAGALEAAPPEIDLTSLAAILASDHRSEKNSVRDASRNPAETLKFFGLQPDMTVVEIWPRWRMVP